MWSHVGDRGGGIWSVHAGYEPLVGSAHGLITAQVGSAHGLITARRKRLKGRDEPKPRFLVAASLRCRFRDTGMSRDSRRVA